MKRFDQRAVGRALVMGVGAGLLLGCSQGGGGGVPVSGTVYVNGKVYTQDAKLSEANAFAVQDGKFVEVGSDADVAAYRRQGFKVVDLGGKMVLPGLHDNHVHAMGTVALDMCDLDSKGVTLDELADKVKACLPKYAPAKGDWLVVNQWSPYEGNNPTASYRNVREVLDKVAPDNPVVLAGTDGHASAYSQRALDLAQDKQGRTVGFNASTLAAGGVFAEFAPYVSLDSGVVREDARSAIPVPDSGLLSASDDKAAKLYDAILPAVSSLLASRGITSVQDACTSDFIRQRYLNMQKQGILNMRVTAATCFIGDDYRDKSGDEAQAYVDTHLARAQAVRQQFAGNPLIKADAVKIFVDGVLEGDPFSSPPAFPNAGMLESFHKPHLQKDADGQVMVSADSEDSGERGIVNYEEKAGLLNDYVSALDKSGFSVHMHSIGDRSTRAAVDALQAARERNGKSGIPHTVAHLQMVHPDDQKRLGALGVFLTYTYAWTAPSMAYDLLVTPFIHPSKAGQKIEDVLYDPLGYVKKAFYPVESTRKEGAVLVAGSDAPVDSRDPRPFLNIASGVTRSAEGDGTGGYTAHERTSLQNMLMAYTINGARAVRQDAVSGSIEKGKSADFIVLDRNLFDLVASGKAQQIADTQVEMTVFMGRQVYRR